MAVRLSRAGREQAIRDAIVRLEALGHYKMFTKGEICRKMGVISTSKMRNILQGMAANHMLVSATTALDGYADEVVIYGLIPNVQMELPEDDFIIINGIKCNYAGDCIETSENA